MGHALGNNYGKAYSFLSKPVLLEGSWTVDNTTGTGTSNVRGQGIKQVFMHTTIAPTNGNPNPAVGYAIIQLQYNYSKLVDCGLDMRSPTTGSALAINGSALTIGNPYQIASVGVGAAGTATIAPVADVSGSLASKYLSLYDSYGNVFILYFIVNGVGVVPSVSGTKVPIVLATNATAATVGAALVTAINALPSGVSGVFSFTASGTTTVTVVSTANLPLAGIPADGLAPLAPGFTYALTVFNTNQTDWQKVGLPAGQIPTIGQAFIATATGFNTNGGSTGTVLAISNSGVGAIEILGEPNTTINPVSIGGSPNVGGYFMIQFTSATSTSVTTAIPSAPAQLSRVYIEALLEQGSIVISGD